MPTTTADAPDPARGLHGTAVYFSGVGTSVAVCWIVQLIADHGEYVMGWYANGVIPAGALLVGILSGTGYAVASRALNLKLSRSFVMGMLTTGIADYVALQWFEYSSFLDRTNLDETAYGFLRYLQDTTENMTFGRAGAREGGSPLGGFGYIFKALELAGFAGGTMIPSAILFTMPYCPRCRRYLKKHAVFAASSSLTRKEALKKKKGDRAAALAAAVAEVTARAQDAGKGLRGRALEEAMSAFASFDRAGDAKAAARATVTIKKCPQCGNHHIAAGLDAVGADGRPTTAALFNVDNTVPPSPTEAGAA